MVQDYRYSIHIWSHAACSFSSICACSLLSVVSRKSAWLWLLVTYSYWYASDTVASQDAYGEMRADGSATRSVTGVVKFISVCECKIPKTRDCVHMRTKAPLRAWHVTIQLVWVRCWRNMFHVTVLKFLYHLTMLYSMRHNESRLSTHLRNDLDANLATFIVDC